MKQKRYLGLELSGAKNSKTTIAVLEYYPKEKKVFLLDLHSGIGSDATGNADQVLIETIRDHADGHPDLKIGVNAPLTLPPCMTCNRKACAAAKQCAAPDAKWMKQFFERSKLISPKKITTSKRLAKTKDFITPYTQRPVELFLKYDVMQKIPEKLKFDLDEALGGNKAPLTARMHFLKNHLGEFEIHEALPKLTVTLLAQELKLNARTLRQYRQLDEGAHARQTIIEKIAEKLDIFIYDRDLKKLTLNLNTFDAMLCALTVLLLDRNECAPAPKGFPVRSGWVSFPKISLKAAAAIELLEDEE